MLYLERKKKMDKKKRRKIIIAVFAVIFLTLNIAWYIGMLRPYLLLKNQMKNNPYYVGDSTIWDEDKYTLAVHYPTYLYWADGNLSVSSPLVEDDRIPTQDDKTSYSSRGGLIIWIEHFTGNIREIGVRLTIDNETREIYLTDSGTARYEEDQPFVDEGQEMINVLFEKAEDAWNLEMPWKE